MTEGLGMSERLTGPARPNNRVNGADDLAGRAAALDAADPLADFRDQFLGSADPKIIAYLDGNSLGRPLRATRDRISRFVEEIWGTGSSVPGMRAGWTIQRASVIRLVTWCWAQRLVRQWSGTQPA